MSVSFSKSTIYEYLFSDSGTAELPCERIERFCKQIESDITGTGTFHQMIVRDEGIDRNVFAELDGKVVCIDSAALTGRCGQIEQKYDEAYGTSVISSAMKRAREEALEGARREKKESSKTSFSGKIFCLMGKSASGKDSVYSLLRDSFEELGLCQLVMYSTRPMRAGEVDGHEYNFVSESELDALDKSGRVIERRDYPTMYGTWSYAIVDDEQLQDDQSYVIKEETPSGAAALVDYFGSDHVFPIYIYVEDGVRLLRALSREMGQDVPKYDEVCRRYLSDCRDFEQVDADEDVPRFVNDNLEKCTGDIEEYIAGVLGKKAAAKE